VIPTIRTAPRAAHWGMGFKLYQRCPVLQTQCLSIWSNEDAAVKKEKKRKTRRW